MNMGVYMGVCEIIELDNYYIYQLNIIQYPILQGHPFSAVPKHAQNPIRIQKRFPQDIASNVLL